MQGEDMQQDGKQWRVCVELLAAVYSSRKTTQGVALSLIPPSVLQ